MGQAGEREVGRGFLAPRPFVPSSPVSPLRADARGEGTKGRSLTVIGGPKVSSSQSPIAAYTCRRAWDWDFGTITRSDHPR